METRTRKSVIGKSKTVEGAVKDALEKLGVTSEEVETKVLEVPSTGFMGFGSKDAKVEVTIKDTSADVATDFLNDVLKTMNLKADINIDYDKKEKNMLISLELDKMGVLIGKHGQTLDSLQYLTSLVVNKNSEDYTRVILDINNYRDKRKTTLENLAKKLAYKAVRNNAKVELEPMNPYERRIIHSYLQQDEKVKTYSEGEGINRHLIIEPIV